MANVNIDHMIDPSRPGFLKSGVMLSASEYLEACRRGLKSYKGQSLALVETSLNPLSGKALKPQAPEALRNRVAEAETRLTEAQGLCDKAFKKMSDAASDRVKFAQQFGGTKLTEAGMNKGKSLDRAFVVAEKDFHSSEDFEQEARIELLYANRALERWVHDEVNRREEAIRQAAEAEKKPTLSLPERLQSLAQKVTG